MLGAGALVAGLMAGAGTVVLGEDDTSTVRSDVGPADQIADVSLAPEPTGVAVAVPDPGPITLAFVGDINAEGSLADRLVVSPDDFVGPFAGLLRDADLAIGNLEAALAEGGTPLAKDFTFRVPPTVLDALRAGGIDVVSVANNHGMDYGDAGFAETLWIKGVWPHRMVIGAGADEDEAFEPWVGEIGGHRIAVVAATQVIDGRYIQAWTAQPDHGGLASAKRVDRLIAEVTEARAAADTVVVYLHWGTETEVCPNASQQELARALVDAGADVIVGGHAHRVQGAGRLDGAFVGYGLGNFLFGAVSPDSAKTGVLLVDVDGREVTGYRWVPGTIVERVPQPLDGPAAAAAVAEWDGLRGCTGLTP